MTTFYIFDAVDGVGSLGVDMGHVVVGMYGSEAGHLAGVEHVDYLGDFVGRQAVGFEACRHVVARELRGGNLQFVGHISPKGRCDGGVEFVVLVAVHECAGLFEAFACHSRCLCKASAGDIGLEAYVAAVDEDKAYENQRRKDVGEPVEAAAEGVVERVGLFVGCHGMDMEDVVDYVVDVGVLLLDGSGGIATEDTDGHVGHLDGLVAFAVEVEVDEGRAFDYEITHFLRHESDIGTEGAGHVAAAHYPRLDVGFGSIGVDAGRELYYGLGEELDVAGAFHCVGVDGGLVGAQQLGLECRFDGETSDGACETFGAGLGERFYLQDSRVGARGNLALNGARGAEEAHVDLLVLHDGDVVGAGVDLEAPRALGIEKKALEHGRMVVLAVVVLHSSLHAHGQLLGEETLEGRLRGGHERRDVVFGVDLDCGHNGFLLVDRRLGERYSHQKVVGRNAAGSLRRRVVGLHGSAACALLGALAVAVGGQDGERRRARLQALAAHADGYGRNVDLAGFDGAVGISVVDRRGRRHLAVDDLRALHGGSRWPEEELATLELRRRGRVGLAVGEAESESEVASFHHISHGHKGKRRLLRHTDAYAGECEDEE